MYGRACAREGAVKARYWLGAGHGCVLCVCDPLCARGCARARVAICGLRVRGGGLCWRAYLRAGPPELEV